MEQRIRNYQISENHLMTQLVQNLVWKLRFIGPLKKALVINSKIAWDFSILMTTFKQRMKVIIKDLSRQLDIEILWWTHTITILNQNGNSSIFKHNAKKCYKSS